MPAADIGLLLERPFLLHMHGWASPGHVCLTCRPGHVVSSFPAQHAAQQQPSSDVAAAVSPSSQEHRIVVGPLSKHYQPHTMLHLLALPPGLSAYCRLLCRQRLQRRPLLPGCLPRLQALTLRCTRQQCQMASLQPRWGELQPTALHLQMRCLAHQRTGRGIGE